MKDNSITERTKIYRRSFFTTIYVAIIMVVLIGGLNVIVDPYFHYHKPLTKYRLNEERSVNDGIARHFDFDAIITGNSLSENFKTSQFDEVLGLHSVKLPYSGAGVREIWACLGRTLGREALSDEIQQYVYKEEPQVIKEYDAYQGYRNDVKVVLVCVDIEDMMRYFTWHRYDLYPDYLYDDELINDIKYILNKETFYRGTIYNLGMTISGRSSTTFDEYSSWERECGPEQACSSLTMIGEANQTTKVFGDKEIEKTYYNIECNVFPVVDANPDVDFIMLIPPYSIAKWAGFYSNGELECRLDNTEYLVNKLLEKKNIRVYSFIDEYSIITDLNRYCDDIHYDREVNEWILDEIVAGRHKIDAENVGRYFKDIREFYINYDYTLLNEYIR